MEKQLSMLCLAGLLLAPQSGAPAKNTLVYDVSSVKPHTPGDGNMSWGASNGELKAVNVSLANLITEAWGLRPDQITGAPAWVQDARWDVTAKVTDADPSMLKHLSDKQLNDMEKQVLQERFHLQAHLATREGPVFDLVPAKTGSKLRPLGPEQASVGEPNAKPAEGSIRMEWNGKGETKMTAQHIGVGQLVDNLAVNLHQTIVNKTGISPDARFDMTLRFAQVRDPSLPNESDAPDLRDALQEQLGLHLEAQRGLVSVVVVDHVERPSED